MVADNLGESSFSGGVLAQRLVYFSLLELLKVQKFAEFAFEGIYSIFSNRFFVEFLLAYFRQICRIQLYFCHFGPSQILSKSKSQLISGGQSFRLWWFLEAQVVFSSKEAILKSLLMFFLHFSLPGSPLFSHLDGLLILFLFLYLVVEYLKVLLFHPSFYIRLFSFVEHVGSFILLSLYIFVFQDIAFQFRSQFVVISFFRGLLLLGFGWLLAKSTKILLLVCWVSCLFALLYFSLFDLSWNSRCGSILWGLLSSLLTFLRLLGLFWLLLFVLKFGNFRVGDFGGFLFLFWFNEGSNIENLSFILVQSASRYIKLFVSGPPTLFERQLSFGNGLRRQFFHMGFLTDMNILYFRFYSISHLFGNLISNFPLVQPLRDQMLLLLGPLESLLQPGNLINLGLQKRDITNNAMQSLIIEGLVMIINLIISDPPIIVIELVDKIMVFLLILQVGVGGDFNIQCGRVEIISEDAIGIVLAQLTQAEGFRFVFSHQNYYTPFFVTIFNFIYCCYFKLLPNSIQPLRSSQAAPIINDMEQGRVEKLGGQYQKISNSFSRQSIFSCLSA